MDAQENDQELSIVDLLAVLLRRRAIILAITSAAIIFSFFVYILAPKYLSPSTRSASLSMTIPTYQVSPVLKSELGIDIAKLALFYAKSASCIDEAARIAGVSKPRVSATIDGGTNLLLNVISATEKEGKAFIRVFSSCIQDKVRKDIVARCEIIVSSMESAFSDQAAASILSDAAKQLALSSVIYLNPSYPIMNIDLEPSVGGGDSNGVKIKQFVLAVLAASFVSIIIAFVVDGIARIRQNEEAMTTLRSAWRSGKLLKKS